MIVLLLKCLTRVIQVILIDRLEKYFKDEFNLSEIDSIKLKYSLELVGGEIFKFLTLLILFSLLGKRNDFICSALSLLTIRPFSGGLHFNTYFSCLVFSGFFFYTSIFLRTNIPLNSKIVIILFMFSLLSTITFTPLPGKSRPDYPRKKRLQFKLTGSTLVLIHFNILVHKNPYFINSIWVITLQSIQILLAKGVMIHGKNKDNC